MLFIGYKHGNSTNLRNANGIAVVLYLEPGQIRSNKFLLDKMCGFFSSKVQFI